MLTMHIVHSVFTVYIISHMLQNFYLQVTNKFIEEDSMAFLYAS